MPVMVAVMTRAAVMTPAVMASPVIVMFPVMFLIGFVMPVMVAPVIMGIMTVGAIVVPIGLIPVIIGRVVLIIPVRGIIITVPAIKMGGYPHSPVEVTEP